MWGDLDCSMYNNNLTRYAPNQRPLRSPVDDDWVRFDYYARRVKKLTFSRFEATTPLFTEQLFSMIRSYAQHSAKDIIPTLLPCFVAYPVSPRYSVSPWTRSAWTSSCTNYLVQRRVADDRYTMPGSCLALSGPQEDRLMELHVLRHEVTSAAGACATLQYTGRRRRCWRMWG